MTDVDRAKLAEMLKRHEGVRPKAYHDTKGILTIGVGRNIEAVGLSIDEIEYLLANDIRTREQRLALALPWFTSLDPVRQAALIDMGFMGVEKLLGFHSMLPALARRDYLTAARQALDSKWADDVKETRAGDVAGMFRTGEWPNA